MSVLAVGVDPERVSAGSLGLFVVVLMAVATVFLVRNMNNRLKRLPRAFPTARPEPDEDVPPATQSGPTAQR